MTSDNNLDGQDKPAASIVSNKDQYNVVLPCDVKDFKQFVSSLLGSHQISEGTVKGSFDISTLEIENFYHLVHQRVSKQNESTLIHLALTVHYDDGTSVTHNDVSHFHDYYHTEPCHPLGVTMKFSYLVTFQEKNVPEKQEIELVIITEANEWRDERISDYHSGGIFEYRITHTERTWASDIAGLLKNHAKTFMKENDGIAKFLNLTTHEFSFYLASSVIILTVLFWTNFTLGIIKSMSVVEMASFYTISISTFIILILVLMSIKAYTDYNLFITNKSYICLTDRDVEQKKIERKRSKKRWYKYFASWFFTIFMGVMANIVYHYIPFN
ncbi:MAG: hypothetical protein ACRBBR_04745 [Cellvibrionaceae bacterium]